MARLLAFTGWLVALAMTIREASIESNSLFYSFEAGVSVLFMILFSYLMQR